MTFEERMRLIMSLDYLLGRKFRGNSSEYARKLGVSRSSFFRLLEYIREEFQVPIIFNKSERRYEYGRKGSMYFGFLPSGNEGENGSIVREAYVSYGEFFKSLNLRD